MKLALRIAAGIFVVFGVMMIPVLIITVDGWRKLAVVPIMYLCWQFAKYNLKKIETSSDKDFELK
jgi:hypothetical protein